jgi:hypothetical protein
MRVQLAMMAALGLAACAPTTPDSGAGFQDYNSYMKQNGTASAQPYGQPAAPAPTGFSTDGAAAAINRANGAPATAVQPTYTPPQPAAQMPSGERPRGNAPSTIQEDTGEMPGVPKTISDENDFGAVSARETIQSDKARIERNKAQYTVDQPTALPSRSGAEGPNIVQYALSATNNVGEQVYKRSSLGLSNPDRNCAKYPSPDLAQQAFLEAGGPDRDRKGLDPDGDGFACSWDPRPFRSALQ